MVLKPFPESSEPGFAFSILFREGHEHADRRICSGCCARAASCRCAAE
jgi:hypothetical protein